MMLALTYSPLCSPPKKKTKSGSGQCILKVNGFVVKKKEKQKLNVKIWAVKKTCNKIWKFWDQDFKWLNKLQYSGVKKRLVCKWSGFRMGSQIQKPTIWNLDKWTPFCQKTIWNLDKISIFWMVQTSNGWDLSYIVTVSFFRESVLHSSIHWLELNPLTCTTGKNSVLFTLEKH